VFERNEPRGPVEGGVRPQEGDGDVPRPDAPLRPAVRQADQV